MIKERQDEMTDVLDIHPIFEQTLAKWILGATDVFDINHNRDLSRGVRKTCRLCQEDRSEESRSHLSQCQATLDLRVATSVPSFLHSFQSYERRDSHDRVSHQFPLFFFRGGSGTSFALFLLKRTVFFSGQKIW
jgi:hypothetical protein